MKRFFKKHRAPEPSKSNKVQDIVWNNHQVCNFIFCWATVFSNMSTSYVICFAPILFQPIGTENHREVLWTFEDIKMLIGTDLPIFCDESYYVSLRLRYTDAFSTLSMLGKNFSK